MHMLYFHFICALVYGNAIWYDYKLTTEKGLNLPVPGFYFSKFVWLTMINLYLQAFYHVFGAALVIFEKLFGKSSQLRLQFDFYATIIIFPISLTVVCLFWGLFYLDPNFLVDEEAKRILSIAWFNHSIHTFPAVAMVLDHLMWKHRRFNKLKSFQIIFVFVISYIFWVHCVYYFYNFWAYPILGELDGIKRAVFIIFCAMFLFAAYMVGDTILYLQGCIKDLIPSKTKKA